MPAMLLLLGRWFTRAERSQANTFLILGNPTTILWMSVLSGYLVQAVGWRVDVHHRRVSSPHLGFFLVAAGR